MQHTKRCNLLFFDPQIQTSLVTLIASYVSVVKTAAMRWHLFKYF